MRVTRVVAECTAVVTAVLGLSLATAGPAAAIDPVSGDWHAYGNTNPISSSSSTWQCTATETIVPGVLTQVCAIRSSSGSSVQTALIVRNNHSTLFFAEVGMHMHAAPNQTEGQLLGIWTCSSSGVAAQSWSVCFGQTLTHSGPVWAQADVNGDILGTSPSV